MGPTTVDRTLRIPPLRRSNGRHIDDESTEPSEEPRPRAREPRGALTWWRIGAIAAFAVVMVLYLVEGSLGWGRASLLGAPLTILVAGLFLPFVRGVQQRWAPGFDLIGIAMLGLAARCLGLLYRYENASDALEYHRVGVRLAESFRNLDFAVDTGRQVPGTGSVRYLAGLTSVATGDTMIAQFFLFTAVAFAGTLCAYVAFAIAVPEGARKKYALLVFLWPSLLVWPSSMGKEALVTGAFGVVALGAARLYTHRRGGMTLLIAGSAGLVMVRPHIALLAIVAVGLGYVFVRSTAGSALLSGTKLVSIVALAAGGAFLVGQTAEFLQLDDLGAREIDQTRAEVTQRTAQGGGEFTPISAENPAMFPAAVVSVLFRPFPFEARSIEAGLTAVEGMLLLAVLAASWRRLAALPGQLLRNPYVAFAFTSVLVFAYAFSVIANFGLLARQRTQILPYLFVLLAVPVAGAARSGHRHLRHRRLRRTDPEHP